MLGYALRRVLSAIPIALIAVTACFFILRLAPGGPFDGERALPPITMQNLRAHYSLDQPIWMQYLIYVGRLLQGDLGPSMVYNDFTDTEMISIGLPFTMLLGFSAFVVATAVGLVAGFIFYLIVFHLPATGSNLNALMLFGVMPFLFIACSIRLIAGKRV